MTDREDTMTRTLHAYAARADLGPADLVEIVERRHRQRRRRHALITASSGLAVAAILVGAAAVIHPTAGRSIAPGGPDRPTASPSGPFPVQMDPGPGPWHLTEYGDRGPALADVWPGTVVHAPTTMPDRTKVNVVAGIDATHLLMVTEPTFEATGAAYSYDTTDSTFRLITQVANGAGPVYTSDWTVTDHWVVWARSVGEDSIDGFDAYKAPLTGGQPTRIASIPLRYGTSYTSPWYATDDAIYWSGVQPGVMRLPLSGGSPQPAAGFGDMYLLTAGSPWAARIDLLDSSPIPVGAIPPSTVNSLFNTRALKSLATGAEVDIAPVPTNTLSMQCSPAFCVGSDSQGAFVQKPDGSGRARLREFGPLTVIGEGGLLSWTDEVGTGTVFWDPVSGRIGHSTAPVNVVTSGTDGTSFVFSEG